MEKVKQKITDKYYRIREGSPTGSPVGGRGSAVGKTSGKGVP